MPTASRLTWTPPAGKFATGSCGLEAIVSVTGPLIPLCPLVEVSEEDFKRIYETDVFGAFNILKSGSLALKESGGGAIVMTLTTAVLRTLELDGLSGGPKTAVSALIRQIALEMGRYNVRCNGVAPGIIATEGTHLRQLAAYCTAGVVVSATLTTGV